MKLGGVVTTAYGRNSFALPAPQQREEIERAGASGHTVTGENELALPIRYNLLSMMSRPTSTLSSVALIGVIIGAFAYLQAVTDSAFNTMVATGDPHTLVVLNRAALTETVSGLGKDEINKLQLTPGVIGGGEGGGVGSGPVVSSEMVAISSAFTLEDAEVAVNTAVRGVDFESACRVRHGKVTILPGGRTFQPGMYEVIVGQAAHRLYRGHDVGDEIQLGTRGLRSFKVVGVFSAGGTAADSEIWGYAETLRDVYGRLGYSSVRLVVADETGARQAIDYIQGPSVNLTATTEREYFRELNTNQMATQYLSLAMIVIMGIAAAFAVANTMYAAVAGRTREIGMLKAVGFARASIMAAFLVEGLMVAALGGVLGCVLSLVCHGAQRNILPTTFTTVSYSLAITPKILGTSLAVAVAIGLAGSIMPAWRAARMNVVSALRES
ncbi:MAG: ABC transporter permease [Phycisphaerales bacterium]|nr:ABC transporter permease [Phycisphaerales bacterium]